MAVHFITEHPQALLSEFNTRLKHREEWKRIDAWKTSDDGLSYTCSAGQWAEKAWMKPRIDHGRLTVNIIKGDDHGVSSAVFSYYQGLLVESFLRQLDLMFSKVVVTPRCSEGDVCE